MKKCAERCSTVQHGPTEMPRNAKLFSGRSRPTCNQPSISKMTKIKSARKNRVKGGKLHQFLSTYFRTRKIAS